MKKVISLLGLALCSSFIYAKKSGFSESELKSFIRKQQFSVDTNAHAVVLDEEGELTISYSERYFYYDYKINFLAKIIDDRGQDITDVEIRLQPDQQLKSVHASVTGLSKANKVVTKENNDPVRYTDYDNYRIAKISFPDAGPGNLIEYSYVIHSQKSIDFPVWNFEDKYPKIHSEFAIIYDAGMDIAVLNSKKYNFPQVSAADDLELCKSCRYEPNINKRLYVFNKSIYARNNVPSFFVPGMFADAGKANGQQLRVQINRLRNYKLKGNSQTIYGFNSEYLPDFDINNWDDANKKFIYGDSKLGGLANKNNGTVDKLTKKLTQNATSDLQKAQTIFAFVRDSITTIESAKDQIYATKLSEDLLESRKGTVADKNILLVSMFRSLDMDACPVVTAINGTDQISADFPAYSSLDYVMANINIEGKNYTLDASEPGLSFGETKPETHNSLSMLVKKNVKFIVPHKISETDKNVYLFTVNFKDPENSTVKGTIRLGKYSSGSLRSLEKMKSQPDFTNQYILSVLQQLPLQTKMISGNINNLHHTDSLVSIEFEATAHTLQSAAGAFDPFLIKTFSYNPAFKLNPEINQNSYFVFNFNLPANIISGSLPKGKNLVLGDKQLVYNSDIVYDSAGEILKVAYRLQSNPAADMSFSEHNYKTFTDKVNEDQQLKVRLSNSN